MSGEWRWSDPRGQQRLVRKDELRAALADGTIPPNAPVWKPGWKDWVPASDVPELMSHALAAANGLVPNVPPPPLFIVAAQSEYESHTPDSRANPGANVEPPPPPRYVPIPAHSSQPKMPAVSPTAAAASPSPQPAPVRKKSNKSTMLGVAPPPQEVVAAAIAASAATGTTGADQLRKALPQDAPASSRLGPDHVPPPAKRSDPPKPDPGRATGLGATGAATVVGVPAINDPRAQPVAAKRSDPPAAKPPVVAPDGSVPMKRPTLILFGGAPQGEDGRASSAPPIVAPAPGASPGKNAVTQAPPWDKGAVELGPDIPKSAPIPHVGGQNEVEEVSASFFIEATDAGPKLTDGSKRQSSMPPPLRPKSMPPPMPGTAPGKARGKASKPPPPLGGNTKRPPPFVPNFTSPHTTERGVGPAVLPPEAAPEPLATTDVIDSTDADATNKYDSQMSEAVAFRGKSFLTYLDPLVTKYPKLAPTRAKLAAFEKGKPRFLLPIIAGLSLLIGFVFFGLIIRAIFGGGDDTTTASTKTGSSATASTSSAAPVTSATHSAAPPVPPPPPTPAVTTPCSVVGSPKTLAGKALVPTGVEVVGATSSIFVGFASAAKDGLVLAVNPTSLAITGQTKTHAGDPLKRVEPLPVDGRPQASANVDKKGDALTGRRTVPSSPSFDIGVADGSLAWAPRNTEKISSLWTLAGSGAVEALRGAPLDGGGGIAITYRRSGAIWLGVATGDKSLTPGNLSSTQGLGPQVGSPVIASSGNAILAVWADRASASDAWGLRLQRWKVGEAPTAAEDFTPPGGGLGAPYMSPGVASLGGGRFLLVWTEGPAQGHQVRALSIGVDGQAQGGAITVSAEGENAGQGQAAVTADGRGVVAYLVSNGPKAFAVAATAISCPK